MNHLDTLHTKKFPVFIPEYYVNRIPTYFTEKRTSRPPMVNGIPVSVEEYMEKDPEYMPQDEFIPEPIYDPFENNITFSMKSTVEIYNAYTNDVNVKFKNPNHMLEMISLIYKYIEIAHPFSLRDKNTKEWVDRLQDFVNVLKSTHEMFIKKLIQKYPHKNQNPHGGAMSITELLTLFKGM